MPLKRRGSFCASCSVFLLVGCLDTASLNNDSGQSALVPGGEGGMSGGSPGGSPSGGANASGGSGGGSGTTASGGTGAGGTGGGGTSGTGGAESPPPPATNDSGIQMPPMEADAGEPVEAPMPELVAGTASAAGCLSYTEPANGMCGSYFCGVDEATLAKALDPNTVCGENMGNTGGSAFVCEGRLVSVVGACARTVKAANFLLTNEQLRPLVQDCVYEDAEIKMKVTEQCLSCFIDVADCAGTNCLVECLAGDSEACDQCRMNNNCEQPLFPCGGFPNPL